MMILDITEEFIRPISTFKCPGRATSPSRRAFRTARSRTPDRVRQKARGARVFQRGRPSWTSATRCARRGRATSPVTAERRVVHRHRRYARASARSDQQRQRDDHIYTLDRASTGLHIPSSPASRARSRADAAPQPRVRLFGLSWRPTLPSRGRHASPIIGARRGARRRPRCRRPRSSAPARRRALGRVRGRTHHRIRLAEPGAKTKDLVAHGARRGATSRRAIVGATSS